jgi:hypothetical protein
MQKRKTERPRYFRLRLEVPNLGQRVVYEGRSPSRARDAAHMALRVLGLSQSLPWGTRVNFTWLETHGRKNGPVFGTAGWRCLGQGKKVFWLKLGDSGPGDRTRGEKVN